MNPNASLDLVNGWGAHMRGTIEALLNIGVNVSTIMGADNHSKVLHSKFHASSSGSYKELKRLMKVAYLISKDNILKKKLGGKILDNNSPVYERLALPSTAIGRICKENGIPWIVEVNAPLALDTYFYGSLEKKIMAKMELPYLMLSSKMIVVSYWLANYYKGIGIPNSQIEVVHNGVDEKFILKKNNRSLVRSTLCLDDTQIVIGYVGNMAHYHNLHTLIGAFQELISENIKIKLILVGNGEVFEFLFNYTKKLKLDDAIMFTGQIPRDEVSGYIDAFDIAILPGNPPYGCPTKLLEYGARKKIVLAPNVEGVQELARHMEHAYLFDQTNMQEIKKGILWVLKNKIQAYEMAEAFYEHVCKNLTWNETAKKIVSFY